jgi:hypothetical protein
MTEIVVVESDICSFEADVVVLKYAQYFYGADAVVAGALAKVTDQKKLAPKPGKHSLIPTNFQLSASYVLFVGVVDLFKFDYAQIRAFSKRAVEITAKELPRASHIAMTIHGVGSGLDEREAFLAQIGGILDAANSHGAIKRISIVEINAMRARRLRTILRETFQRSDDDPTTTRKTEATPIDAGIESESKRHVFVAMPFAKEYEDTYVFGIQSPIHSIGLLCERVDMVVFTGDILERVKTRIDTASLVVADLTGANANVYLEVGYARGRGRPTLLVARSGNELKFDVRGQRCIIYDNIVDLAKKLSNVARWNQSLRRSPNSIRLCSDCQR